MVSEETARLLYEEFGRSKNWMHDEHAPMLPWFDLSPEAKHEWLEKATAHTTDADLGRLEMQVGGQQGAEGLSGIHPLMPVMPEIVAEPDFLFDFDKDPTIDDALPKP